MLNNNSIVFFFSLFVFTISFRFALSHVKCLYKPFGFCPEMNGSVFPWLMRQLMVFSCLISIVLSASPGPWRTPEWLCFLAMGSGWGGWVGGLVLTSLQTATCLGLSARREEMEGWTTTH